MRSPAQRNTTVNVGSIEEDADLHTSGSAPLDSRYSVMVLSPQLAATPIGVAPLASFASSLALPPSTSARAESSLPALQALQGRTA